MLSVRVVTAALLLPVLLTGGCGSQANPETPPQNAASPQSSKATAGIPTVLSSGFGQQGEYAWITAVVKNDKGAEGRFVTVQFNIFDQAGTLILSESQTESFSRAGEVLAIGTQVTVPGGAKVGKVEPTAVLGSTTGDKPFPEIKTGPIKITAQQYAKDRFAVSFPVMNPGADPLKDLRVGIVCFDSGGKVIGGTSDYPDVVPGSGQAIVTADVITNGKPDKCEAYVGAPA